MFSMLHAGKGPGGGGGERGYSGAIYLYYRHLHVLARAMCNVCCVWRIEHISLSCYSPKGFSLCCLWGWLHSCHHLYVSLPMFLHRNKSKLVCLCIMCVYGICTFTYCVGEDVDQMLALSPFSGDEVRPFLHVGHLP